MFENYHNSIFQWTGIPVSIGLAPTKTLAKIANSLAKKSKIDCIYDLSSPSTQIEVLGIRWKVFGVYLGDGG